MRHDVVVLGAGVAGLGAALSLAELGVDFCVLEAEATPGGLVSTDVLDGFGFERTGHVLHFSRPPVEARFRGLGIELERIERRAAILVGGAEVPYPFQYNLWALPSRGVARAVLDDMRAAPPPRGDGTLDELLRSSWGGRALELFFRPYNEKLWGRRLETLPADCVGRYLPQADVELAERGAVMDVSVRGYNGTFLYPRSGRLGAVADALAARVAGRLRCGAAVERVDLRARELRTGDGETIAYSRLISTVPLDALLRMCELPADRALFAATSIVNLRIALRGRLRTAYHWLYLADADVPFHRIGFPRNVNERTCPDGCTSLSLEYTIPAGGRRAATHELVRSALDYVSRRRLAEVDEVLFHDERIVSPAYVVHRSPGRRTFAGIAATLRERDVLLAGRFGTWDYLSVEEAFDSGLQAAAECATVPA